MTVPQIHASRKFTAEIAMLAARMGLKHHLHMADSFILATANAYQCVIWTQDADFKHLPGVKFFLKMS
jgi:predicted nucleic acid-binding protein